MMWLHAECNNNVGMNPFLFLYRIYTLFFSLDLLCPGLAILTFYSSQLPF